MIGYVSAVVPLCEVVVKSFGLDVSVRYSIFLRPVH